MNIVEILSQIGGGVSSLVTVLLVVILYRSGVLDSFLKKPSKNGNGNGNYIERFNEIDREIRTLEENHINHLNQKMEKMEDLQKDMLNILRNIQQYGIKCTKE